MIVNRLFRRGMLGSLGSLGSCLVLWGAMWLYMADVSAWFCTDTVDPAPWLFGQSNPIGNKRASLDQLALRILLLVTPPQYPSEPGNRCCYNIELSQKYWVSY